MQPNSQIITNTKPQAGVTLLLAILVLSALVGISFSFASIILIEIRSSGDVARTEPAYYAVQGVVEETIFKIKRQIPPLASDNTNPYNFDFGACNQDKPIDNIGSHVATLNPVSLFSGVCNTNPSADVKDIVPPTAGNNDHEKAANTRNIYSLYDPSNPYTNTQNVGGTEYPSAYNKIEFYYLAAPGGNMKLYFCSVDRDCVSDDQWDSVVTLDSNSRCAMYFDPDVWTQTAGCTNGGAILANKAYQIFIIDTSAVDAGVEIKSWGPDPLNHQSTPTVSVPKGLAVFGQYSVNVTATSLGITRKYLVNIPSN